MNNINDLQEQFDNLIKKYQELIKKLKKEQNTKVKRWKPKDGEKYYYITTTSQIDDLIWTGTTEKSVDYVHYKLGNCFQTKKEAQKELDRRFAEQELLDMCNWKDGACAEIMYDFMDKEFYVGYPCTETCYSSYRFANKEASQKAIDTLGTEKLKLIFRID